MKKRLKVLFLISFCCLLFPNGLFCFTNEDVIPLDFEVSEEFELEINAVIDENYTPPDPAILVTPSINNVVPGLELGSNIDFGTLLRIRTEQGVRLVSEYKVVVSFSCRTNTGSKYYVTQSLTAPLKGQNTSAEFPDGVFVCQGYFTEETGNSDNGEILVTEMTPVSIIQSQIIYESSDFAGEDISNYLTVEYWITDQSATPILQDQAADTYTTQIIFTMTEEL